MRFCGARSDRFGDTVVVDSTIVYRSHLAPVIGVLPSPTA
jgi:hypothetical protein